MQIYKRAKIVYNIVSLRSASDQFIKQEETKMNKMRFHKVLSLVLVLVLAGSILAGCGNSNSTPASGAASTGGSQGTQGSQAKDSLNVVTYADPIGVFPCTLTTVQIRPETVFSFSRSTTRCSVWMRRGIRSPGLQRSTRSPRTAWNGRSRSATTFISTTEKR